MNVINHPKAAYGAALAGLYRVDTAGLGKLAGLVLPGAIVGCAGTPTLHQLRFIGLVLVSREIAP